MFSALMLLAGCGKKEENKLDFNDGQVYFFYQVSCPHCHHAAEYIKENHPDLKPVSIDVRQDGNMALFEQAVKHYGITEQAGTPLITLGKNYIMGWSPEQQKLFSRYLKVLNSQKSK